MGSTSRAQHVFAGGGGSGADIEHSLAAEFAGVGRLVLKGVILAHGVGELLAGRAAAVQAIVAGLGLVLDAVARLGVVTTDLAEKLADGRGVVEDLFGGLALECAVHALADIGVGGWR